METETAGAGLSAGEAASDSSAKLRRGEGPPGWAGEENSARGLLRAA